MSRAYVQRAGSPHFVCQSCGAAISPDETHQHRCGRSDRPAADLSCRHRGAELRRETCPTCRGHVEVKVFGCELYGDCALAKEVPGVRQVCGRCPDRSPVMQEPRQQYAVPELPAAQPVAVGRAIRVGLLTPALAVGGIERWWFALCRHWSDSAGPVVPGGIALTDSGAIDTRAAAEAQRYGPLLTGPDAAGQLGRLCDVIMLWGHADAGKLLAGFAGPRVLVSHGAGDWTRRILAAAAPVCTHLAAVSRPARDAYPAELHSRVQLVRNGIDLDRCAPTRSRDEIRAGWRVRPQQVAIGYVGRYSAEKSPAAAAIAAAGLPDAVAIYVGPRMDWPAVRRQLAGICGEERLVTLGPRHVGDVLGGLDCLISASAAEGGPLCVAEAWAAGVPVVSTVVGMIPELEEQYGPLVERLPLRPDPRDLAAAVLRATGADGAPCSILQAVERIDRARGVAWRELSAARMAADWARLISDAAAP